MKSAHDEEIERKKALGGFLIGQGGTETDAGPLVQMDDTMLYRQPTDDSDEAQIADIWGAKLETRVVRASDVEGMLADGWVRDPLKIGAKADLTPAPTSDVSSNSASTLTDTRGALAAAEKLAEELGETVKSLTVERDNALQAASDAAEKVKALETDLSAEKALRASGTEHIRRLEEEAKKAKGKAPA